MKLSLIVSAILSIALYTAAADGEVGRYQLVVANVDLGNGPVSTLFRIDTGTGETYRLLHASTKIPEAKRFGDVKEFSYEGWVRVENSLQEAMDSTQKIIESLPAKKSKNDR